MKGKHLPFTDDEMKSFELREERRKKDRCPTQRTKHCKNFDELYDFHLKNKDKRLIITTHMYGEGYNVTVVCKD